MGVTVATELRCPTGPRRLLAKLRQEGKPVKVVPGNLMELHCRDCTKIERLSDPSVIRVLHRFDLAGELVETVIE